MFVSLELPDLEGPRELEVRKLVLVGSPECFSLFYDFW